MTHPANDVSPARYCVLLISDHDEVRRRLAGMLQRHHCEVIEAADAPSALIPLRHRADLSLIVLDISTREVARVVHRYFKDPASPSIPILVFSARPDSSVERRAPLSLVSLVELINRLLAWKRDECETNVWPVVTH